MAQQVQLMGAIYNAVPAVMLPDSNNVMHRFDDATVTTAAASDVASGKIFLASDGTITTGTASGGGSSPWTFITSQDVTVSTTSTSAAAAATISCGSAIATKDKVVWVHIRDKAGARAGYCYGSDAFFTNYNKANGSTSAFAVPAVICLRYTTSSAYAGTAGQYGVYGYSIGNTGSLIVRRRYNSNYSLTIDGTYAVSVYTLNLPDGLVLFS